MRLKTRPQYRNDWCENEFRLDLTEQKIRQRYKIKTKGSEKIRKKTQNKYKSLFLHLAPIFHMQLLNWQKKEYQWFHGSLTIMAFLKHPKKRKIIPEVVASAQNFIKKYSIRGVSLRHFAKVFKKAILWNTCERLSAIPFFLWHLKRPSP